MINKADYQTKIFLFDGQMENSNSTIFTWKKKDFRYLLKSCDKDEATPYILKYLPKTGKIVEAGCGLGRFVKYLLDKGYNIEGIEYSKETVHIVEEIDPGLCIIQGDVLNMPYANNSIDGIISLGVIEHFISGCEKPLKEMYRVLKPGGIAIITVPSFNLVRRLKKSLYVDEMNYVGFFNLIRIAQQLNIVRKLFRKSPINKSFSYNRKKSKLNIYPLFGDFFEYRFSKKQFEDALVSAGYTIIESVPIAHMDGVYHEFGSLFVSFKNWEFYPNIMGQFLNNLLFKTPFCHNHMHLCVVKKD